MYLKRVTITGFKSFAAKTVLDLERGITAVVGPNGSGKSNLADAVRWALGEQSKGRLRLADREEVVFAGTERRAKASFAEVTLLFDNQDGAFPLDLTEVEVSRRLYRSGETDYRLAGRSVRLTDVQQLLAEAGLGTNTYAVVGQGMIDSFLLSSPSERKLLFDEAAGIRGSELRREASMRKLQATETNLTRLRDIHAELEPRLASLKRTAAAVEEQRALEADLTRVRTGLIAAAETQLGDREQTLGTSLQELTHALHQLRHNRQNLERTQAVSLRKAAAADKQRASHQAEVSALEKDYDAQLKATTSLRGQQDQLAAGLERVLLLREREAAIIAELTAIGPKSAELIEELAANQAAAERAARVLGRADRAVAKVQANLVETRQSASDGTQQQYVAHALAILKTIAQGLGDDKVSPQQLRLLVHKAGRLLSHATKTGEAQILAHIRDAQARLEAAMTNRETATEHQTNIIITGRSLEIDMAHQQAQVQQLEERLTDIRADLSALATQEDQLATIQRQTAIAEHQLDALKHQLDKRRAELTSQAPDTSAQVTESATRLERLRSQQGAAELQVAATRQELTTLKSEQRRYTQLARAWGLKPNDVAQPAHAQSANADLDHLERTQARLETELATRQSLQHETESEYAEVNQRYGDLAVQIADLEQAKVDLGRIVTELDQMIRIRFKENFTVLSQRFGDYFVRLFGGGAATLELEEQEGGEYGILIKATLKGKRAGNLSALSGGERAMAGVALLAAILSVNPSSFVVLDEIDAALDEANSGRLAGILDELSQASQLIVITHNRQTMKAAKVLFGVTMNEHHVSHLLSLRLEDASALAAR